MKFSVELQSSKFKVEVEADTVGKAVDKALEKAIQEHLVEQAGLYIKSVK